MAKKKRFLLLLLVCVAAAALLVLGGCKPKPIDEGPETGVYYCDADGEEYQIVLNSGNRFSFVVLGDNKSGTYVLENGVLTLTFLKEEDGQLAASYSDGGIELTYKGERLVFLPKITYTVTFDTDGGSAVEAVSVVNGRTVDRPVAEPQKTDCVFVGWYSDKNFTRPYDFGSAIVCNTTIFARFAAVVHGQSEYAVTFDLNYDGGKPSEAETVGGKLLEVPSPEREGYIFKGWWISMYEDRDRLSYMYADGMVFCEDTTLFALWQEKGSAALPLVYVSAEGVSWDGVGTAVRLKVINPLGAVIVDETIGATAGSSKKLDFANGIAGDYEITLTAGDVTVSRYYKNKALNRVSDFSVADNGLLIWKPVPDAARYYVDVVCGDENHVHTHFDNGASVYFDFSNCKMPPEGIVFVVTATAEGYASSVSRAFVYLRKLPVVSGLYLDTEIDLLVWDALDDASDYTVSVNGGAPVSTGGRNSFSLKEYSGEISVAVRAYTPGFVPSDEATFVFEKNQLATPSGIVVSADRISWNVVADATSYIVKIDGKNFETDENCLPFSDTDIAWSKGGYYSLKIKAAGESESKWSDETVFGWQTQATNLRYFRNVISWDYVAGVSSYEVRINGGSAFGVAGGVNFAEIKLTKAGENLIEVRCADENTEDESEPVWTSLKVWAHTLSLDAMGGEAVAPLYLAVGDKAELAETSKTGYDFGGWYNKEGGAAANGAEFSEEYFPFNADVILYANWVAHVYTITLDCGEFGTLDGQRTLTAEVAYGSDFVLPVPDVNYEIKVFTYWCASADGYGVAYTDSEGRSRIKWPHTSEDIVLYAYYVDAIDYVRDGDGYAVKAGPRISQVTHLIIPATYTPVPTDENPNPETLKVVSIQDYAFLNCTKLVSVSIPNTVRTISLTAFDGCRYIERYEVREIEGETDPVYFAQEGTLLYKNIVMQGEVEIALVPATFTGSYRIPDAVTKITQNAFAKTKLEEIIVPASVKTVARASFSNSTTLKSIVFEQSITEEIPLTMSDGAIVSCTALVNLTLPARLKKFEKAEHEIFSLFGKLENINIVGSFDNAAYSSIDGVLFNAAKDTLLYYPAAHNKDSGVYTLPTAALNIAERAFYTNPSSTKIKSTVKEVYLHANVRTIGAEAFAECDSLTKVVFVASERPAGTMVIGRRAFADCSKLAELVFEESGTMTRVTETTEQGEKVSFKFEYTKSCGVAQIGEEAFESCSLQSLLLPSTLTAIGKNAFADNSKLNDIDLSHVRSDLQFGEYVFRNCRMLESVEIPDNVGYIPFNSVFYNCTKLKTFVVSPDNPNYYADEQGVLYNADVTEIAYYPEGLTGDYVIPNTIKSIGGGVFIGKTNIVKITIPASVVNIGNSAFENCANLAEVLFVEGGEELLTIGDKAFYRCTALKSIKLPERTLSLGENCFDGSGLSDIDFGGVRTIAANAFGNTKSLSVLTIPASVTEIGKYAFSSSAISEIKFAPRATGKEETPFEPLKLGKSVFTYCASLKKATFPDGLTSIPDSTFYNCAALTYVYVPKTVANGDDVVAGVSGFARAIGPRAFYHCESLAEIEFGLGGTGDLSFAERAFWGCTSLKTLNLPNRLRGVENDYDAFQFGLKLAGGLSNPNAVMCFSEYDGRDCAAVESINVEEGGLYFSSYDGALYTAGRKMLVFCPQKKSGTITIAKEAETFRVGCFWNCQILSAIEFEEGGTADFELPSVSGSFTYTTDALFYNCYKLSSIAFPARLVKIGDNALYWGEAIAGRSNHNISVVTFAPDCRLNEIGKSAFKNCKIKEIELPASVTTLGQKPFEGCSIARLVVPDSLASDGFTDLVAGISGLKNIECRSTCKNFTTVDGVLFSKDGTELVFCPADKVAEVYTVPADVRKISDYSFKDNVGVKAVEFESAESSLTIGAYAFQNAAIVSVTLPERLVSISDRAFSGCAMLARVTFEPQCRLTTLGNYAFEKCASLTEISIPDLTTSIGIYAFSGCSLLANFNLGANSQLITIGQHAFRNCSALVEFTAPATLAYFGKPTTADTVTEKTSSYTFYNCKQLAKVDLSACSVEYIAMYTFQHCSSLATVLLPQGLKGIGQYAFQNCVKLSEITLPEGLVTINGQAFSGCGQYIEKTGLKTGLKSITVPSTVTTIGKSAFEECAALEEATIKSSLIGESMFLDCRMLKKVTIGVNTESIKNLAFSGCTSLSDIDLQSNILTEIGKGAFQSAAISDFVIPDSVTSLGAGSAATGADGVFADCSKLLSVTIGTGVANLTDCLFANCQSLETVEFKENGKTAQIGKKVFYNCRSLKAISLPSTVNQIGLVGTSSYTTSTTNCSVFEGCAALVSISLPSAVAKIGQNTFKDCSSLQTVTFNGNVLEFIALGAFSGCASLTDFTFPMLGSSFTLGASAFAGCSSLTKFVLPALSGSFSLGASAFSGCSSLAGIVLPDYVKTIPDNAFLDCVSLETVLMQSDAAGTVGASAFAGCVKLKNVTLSDGITQIKQKAFLNCAALEQITLPQSLTKLGNGSTTSNAGYGNVFENCVSLKEITLPEGVSIIDVATFKNCESLSKVTVSGALTLIREDAFEGCGNIEFAVTAENEKTEIVGNAVYSEYTDSFYTLNDKNKTASVKITGRALIHYFGNASTLEIEDGTDIIARAALRKNSTVTKVVLPASVMYIDDYAFTECITLAEINLENVKSIDGYAFQGCTELTSVALRADVIYSYAFSNCTSLEEIDLNGAKFLNSYVFSGCTALTDVVVPESVIGLNVDVFKDCTGLKTAEVNVGNLNGTVSSSGTAGNGWFKGCTSLKTVTFADGLLRLENYLFEGCTSLTTIKLPATLQRLSAGYGAFKNCTSLVSLTIPAGVTAIENNEFVGCASLKEIIFEGSVTKIGNASFDGCAALDTIDLSQVNSVGNNAFRGCAALEYVNLPQAATLGANSFESCSALKEASIPKVAKISNYAFSNCGKLVSVSAAAATEAGDFAFFGCASLESISLPELKTLGKSAFAGCSSLKEFVAPNLTSIGDYAFCEVSESEDGTSVYNGCPLTGLDLTNVTSVGKYALAGLTQIKELVIPSGAMSVGEGAFAGWTEEQVIRIDMSEEDCDWTEGWNRDMKATIYWKSAETEAEA